MAYSKPAIRAHLTPREERDQRIADELERLRREVEEKRLGSLNLDEFVDSGLHAAAASPVSPRDLEALLTDGPTHRHRFRPHPTIDRANLLDWAGLEHAVTFDRAVFDEHPETVRFLTPGDRLFESLLSAIGRPAPSDDQPGPARAEHDWITPRVAYYQRDNGQAVRVESYDQLLDALREPSRWEPATLQAAANDALAVAQSDIEHERQVVELANSAEPLALEERAR